MKYKLLKGYNRETASPEVVRIPGYFPWEAATDFCRIYAVPPVGTKNAEDRGHWPHFLLINTGYLWDGASGPARNDDGNALAALAHDVGYECGRLGLLPPQARKSIDKTLRFYIQNYRPIIRDEQGNPCRGSHGDLFRRRMTHCEHARAWVRGWYYYWGVRLFAGEAWRARPKGERNEQLLEA
jgi:hypothetical protein